MVDEKKSFPMKLLPPDRVQEIYGGQGERSLTKVQRLRIKKLIAKGAEQRQVAEMFGVSQPAIHHIVRQFNDSLEERTDKAVQKALNEHQALIEENVVTAEKILNKHLKNVAEDDVAIKAITPRDAVSYATVAEKEFTKMRLLQGKPTSHSVHDERNVDMNELLKQIKEADIFGKEKDEAIDVTPDSEEGS